MAALGELVVSLTAETARFREDLGRAAYVAEKNFKQISSAAKTIGGVLGAAFSVQAIVGYSQRLIDLADRLSDVSQQTGVAAERLSALGNAAQLNGSNADTLNAAFIRLNKAISEGISGSKEQVEAFKLLGVASGDLSKLSTEEIFYRISDAFSGAKDNANKTAIAMALLGKSGAELIPVLNQGSASLKKFEATFTQDQIDRFAKFNDNMDLLAINLQRVAAAKLNPIVEGINGIFKEFEIIEELGKKQGKSFWQAYLTIPYDDVKREFARLKAVAEQEAEAAKKAVAGKKDDKRDLGAIKVDTKKPDDEVAKLLDKQAESVIALRIAKEDLAVAELFLAGASVQQIEIAQRNADAYKRAAAEIKFNEQVEKDRQKTEEEGNRLREATLTKFEKYVLEQEKIKRLGADLLKQGADQVEVNDLMARAQAKLNDEYNYANSALYSYAKSVKDVQYNVENGLVRALGSLEDSLIGVMTGTKSVADAFKSMTVSILEDMLRIYIRKTIIGPIADAIFGAFSFGGTTAASGTNYSLTAGMNFGGTGLKIPSGGQADGGNVMAGRSYLVGEKGAEVFTPATNGLITPNDALGGGTTVNQTINIQAGVSQTVRAEITSMMPRIMEATKAAVADAKLRGGTYGKAFA